MAYKYVFNAIEGTFDLVGSSGGGGSPVVQVTGDDDSVAIAVAGNLNFLSRDSTVDNPNGIQAVADPDEGDTFYYQLTNRFHGEVTTTDDTPTFVCFCPMDQYQKTYLFKMFLVAYDETNNLSISSEINASFRTTSDMTAPVPLEEANYIDGIDPDDSPGYVLGIDIDGFTDAMELTVTGVADTTVRWKAWGFYTIV